MKNKKQSNTKSKDNNDSPQELQQLLPKMLTLYKRKCENFGIIINLKVKQILDKSIETNRLHEIMTAEHLGPAHARFLFEVLMELKYDRLKQIKLWNGKIQDEGVRNICRYLEERQNNNVENLDVLDNDISALGCQFIGKTLTLKWSRVKYLKLDDNLIGNEGLKNLSIGLRANSVLTKLSLKYCNIDHKGVPILQDILANIHTKIRSIKLQGNPLGNQGVYELLRVVELNEMLEKINIADTKLNLLDFMAKNQYELQENQDEEQQQQQEQKQEVDDQNPQKKPVGTPAKPNIQNVKQTLIQTKVEKQQLKKQKIGVLKQKLAPQKQKKPHYKVTKSINQEDKSLSASIMRLLTRIMSENLLIRKYDLRFNPISNDAATIIFQYIEHNTTIKDVELNTNVDSTLRQNLDTLMRKRTGRMPKGRGKGGAVGKGKGKKKK